MIGKRRLFLRYLVVMLCIAVSGALLLYTSQSVQREQDNLARIEASIEREQQMMRVLEAEWAKLNSPYNLEILTQQSLDLVPPNTANITPDLPAMISSQEDAVDDRQEKLKIDISGQALPRKPTKKPSEESVVKRKSPKTIKENKSDDFQDVLGRLKAKEGGSDF